MSALFHREAGADKGGPDAQITGKLFYPRKPQLDDEALNHGDKYRDRHDKEQYSHDTFLYLH